MQEQTPASNTPPTADIPFDRESTAREARDLTDLVQWICEARDLIDSIRQVAEVSPHDVGAGLDAWDIPINSPEWNPRSDGGPASGLTWLLMHQWHLIKSLE
ncbi:MAG: hypothetical protein EPN34_07000 [Burkholderiaceae bacterium]|nr:MAG: hypothetical protein EPN34_07000 [Burkholderiaceae bacterium]